MGQYICKNILFEPAKGIQHLQLAWLTPHLKYQIGSIFFVAQSSTTKQCINLALPRIMYNWRPIERMIRCFLPTSKIDKIDLCVNGIEIHLHYLVSHISQEFFDVLTNTLYVEKSVVSQVITFNKSVMTQKRDLVTVTLSIRHNQVMSKIYNARLWSMKVLMIIKT